MANYLIESKIQEYLLERESHQPYFENLERMRRDFVAHFPARRIRELSLDEYVIGKQNPQSFCHWMEQGLAPLGKISGPSTKFGIYYGKTSSDPEIKYRFSERKFGTETREGFRRVKNAIASLLEAGANEDDQELANNPISTVFKGKILATYFPNLYLDIYSSSHLDFFLVQLSLDPPNLRRVNEIYKRNILVNFKNGHPVMRGWSLQEFNKFLYWKIGHPKDYNPNQVITDESLEMPVFPPRNEVQPEFIDVLPSVDSPRSQRERRRNSGMPDFEAKNRRNKMLGDKGELYVFQLEKTSLEMKNKIGLSEKVEHTALTQADAGYDILSLELDGSPKYIEVKSTTAKPGSLNFFLTANELEKAQELENYYIYVVFEVASRRPKVWRWRHPFKDEREREGLEPVLYRFQSA